MADGITKDLEEAKRSIRGIRRKIHEAGAVALRKLKLSRPKQEYEFNPEFEAEQVAKWKGLKKKKVYVRKKP